MNEVKILCLSKQNLIDNNCFDMNTVMDIIENVLIDYKNGNIILPDKISQIFKEETQERINCMPATLLKDKVCGVKWVSVFPNNPFERNLPNVNGTMIISNIENGLPIAFMDATILTNVRTAAVGGVAAKYLAKKDSQIIGFIGSGEQAKNHLIAMKTICSSLKTCKVASKHKKSEERFIEEMKNKFPDMEFINCNSDYKMAVKDADIIVTATSSQEQILKADWIKKGAFYCHVGGIEDDFNVPKLADKIVCDDWESVKHRKQTISIMYQNNLLKDDNIYANLADLVSGEKKGRQNDEEFIYFNSVGLSFIDVAIGNYAYKRCIENNSGTYIEL